MIHASTLIFHARELRGTPWCHEGRSEHGVDCIGLVLLAGMRAGVDFLKITRADVPPRYSRSADPTLLRLISAHCQRIEIPVAGCLLFFRFDQEQYPRHLGLLSEEGTVIHAEAKARKQVVEHGYRAHWRRWTHSAWHLPGVMYE